MTVAIAFATEYFELRAVRQVLKQGWVCTCIITYCSIKSGEADALPFQNMQD